ncbi:MAG TPA: tRNA 2-selenouridine(34) synthase MnmH [Gammaproteobacteria bacterium]|nr:tRNA 2-selenouridine(34) synthase MnmH [Gammaproteobacteria bacterium]
MPASDLKEIDDLRTLFLNDVPLLDVRAPVEFAEGAFPTAHNLPLIDDAERHQIGITYKEDGQDKAIELGEHLVSGELRQQRIAQWRQFLTRYPDAVLYCFRGGMRSQISQRWLLDSAGLACPRVRGGYKAMRRFLIDQLAVNSAACRPVVIGGRTGVGKTRLLADCRSQIDLEALANHRGSAFGNHPQPQPSQIDFENALSIALLKQVAAGNRPFLVEDESRNIGRRHIPGGIFERLQHAPLVLLEASDEERIAITLQEYVHDALAEFSALYGTDDGFAAWAGYLRDSMQRIRRRLGGDRHTQVNRMLDDAIARHAASGDVTGHADWIAFLLHEYYDGMYEYQLANKADRIVFRGDRRAVLDYLRSDHDIDV